MKNIITPRFHDKNRRENAIEILSGMDADIVDSSGNFPNISIDRIVSLRAGGSVYISVLDSKNCWLVTDSNDITYEPKGIYGSPFIRYVRPFENSGKYTRKEISHCFHINLAGQRGRQI